MAKKNNDNRISNPEELDKILQKTNPLVWVVLGALIVLLLNFFAWTIMTTLEIKVSLKAQVSNEKVTAYANAQDIDKIKAGQKVYMQDMEGETLSVESDGKVILSEFPIKDGEYDCYVVVREVKPIDFLLE